MARRSDIDWEAIERDYRAGILSINEVSEKFVVSSSQIRLKAKQNGWARGLQRLVRDNEKASKSSRVPVPLAKQQAVEGYLYVIFVDADRRYYKIGRSNNFIGRVGSHQTSSPHEVCVACAFYVPNVIEAERHWHEEFADQRVRGEWFALSDENVRQIAASALLI